MLFQAPTNLSGLHHERGRRIKQYHGPRLPVLPPAPDQGRAPRAPNLFEKALNMAKGLVGPGDPPDYVRLLSPDTSGQSASAAEAKPSATAPQHAAAQALFAAMQSLVAEVDAEVIKAAEQQDEKQHAGADPARFQPSKNHSFQFELSIVNRNSGSSRGLFERSQDWSNPEKLIFWPKSLVVHIPLSAIADPEEYGNLTKVLQVQHIFMPEPGGARVHVPDQSCPLVVAVDVAGSEFAAGGASSEEEKEEDTILKRMVEEKIVQRLSSYVYSVIKVDSSNPEKLKEGAHDVLVFALEVMNAIRPAHEC